MNAPTLPGFTYLERLGSGGFADVFLYEQEWPRRKVAVKVVRDEVPISDRERSLFTHEANAMAHLADHPYIVTVIDAGVTTPAEGRRPYLVMRYCPPPDLGVRVRNSPLSVPDALATGIKLASAIETAHTGHILHRDIKPSNVLLSTYGEPALTDFGIAGRIQDVAHEREVRISFPWSPPELLDGTSNGSVASDVYSLGATIWNLLVGRSPFSIPHGDNSSRGLTVRILHSPVPPTHRPDVPPTLDRLLQQTMAKDPAHRPGSALELARALQQIEGAMGLARTPIAVETVAASYLPGRGEEELGDATIVKPATILPDEARRTPMPPEGLGTSGARPRLAPQSPIAPPSPGPVRKTRRGTLVWTLVGFAVLALLVAGVVLMVGGDEADGPDQPVLESARTPLELNPTPAVPTPRVGADRTAGQVRFSWQVIGGDTGGPGGTGGDSFEWQRTDTGESGRTTKASLVLRSPGRVCVQVRLIRDTTPSAWTQTCG